MRIWHFHYYPPISGGGLARYVLDFTQIFGSIEQRIVYCRATDSFADDAGNLSTMQSLLPISAFRIEMLQPDDLALLHVTHTPHASWRSFNDIICADVARTIVVVHTDLEHSFFNILRSWSSQLRLRFINRAYRRANRSSRVVVFTPHQKFQLAQVAGVDATIAPMPIFLGDFDCTDASTDSVEELLMLGERNVIKGYDRFIEFAALSPELTFLSVGSGDLTCKDILSKTVREIETLPYQSSMRYLRGAKALLVFSRTESWGRTILEAFLFKKPVIAFEPVGVLKEVPCEWVAYLGTLKYGSTGLSKDELTSVVSKLNSNSTARRIWTQNKNEEYRAQWSRIISGLV